MEIVYHTLGKQNSEDGHATYVIHVEDPFNPDKK